MKNKGRLLRLGFVTCCLLIVLLSACDDDDYEATVKGIRFYQEVGVLDDYTDELVPTLMEINDGAYQFIVDSTPQNLYIICEVPSIIREKLTVTVDPAPVLDVELSDFPSEKLPLVSTITAVPKGKLLLVSTSASTAAGPYPITVTAGPGSITKKCNVYKE
jgi:hypothetical protein